LIFIHLPVTKTLHLDSLLFWFSNYVIETAGWNSAGRGKAVNY